MLTTIVLADDHPIIRSGIRRLLDTREDLRVVGEAANGDEAVELVREHRPDLALLDLQMPLRSGLDATCWIAKSALPTRVLVLSVNASAGSVEAALEAGAAGYVAKTAGLGELLQAIDRVRSGGTYVSPTCAEGATRSRGAAPPGAGALTKREREVLRLVAEGLSSKEIARQLGIALKTVDAHRSSLMRKAEVHKVSALVRFAVREGLVQA